MYCMLDERIADAFNCTRQIVENVLNQFDGEQEAKLIGNTVDDARIKFKSMYPEIKD